MRLQTADIRVEDPYPVAAVSHYRIIVDMPYDAATWLPGWLLHGCAASSAEDKKRPLNEAGSRLNGQKACCSFTTDAHSIV